MSGCGILRRGGVSPHVKLHSIRGENLEKLLNVVDSLSRLPSMYTIKGYIPVPLNNDTLNLRTLIRVKEDSMAVISLMYMGIEVARAILTSDSILLINRREKTWAVLYDTQIYAMTGWHYDISYLGELLTGRVHIGGPTFAYKTDTSLIITHIKKRKLRRYVEGRRIRKPDKVFTYYLVDGPLRVVKTSYFTGVGGHPHIEFRYEYLRNDMDMPYPHRVSAYLGGPMSLTLYIDDIEPMDEWKYSPSPPEKYKRVSFEEFTRSLRRK